MVTQAWTEIPSLNQLWFTMSLRPIPAYAEIVATCKRYDKAMEQHRVFNYWRGT